MYRLFMVFCLSVFLSIAWGAPSQAKDNRSVTVAAVGDVMMGSEGRMPPDGGKDLFRAAKPYLRGHDVVFLNHEGTLTDRGLPAKPLVKGRSYCFRTPPEYATHLADAGFNMASLANNHSFDYNREGLDMTQETLAGHGIAYSHHSGSTAAMDVRGLKVVMAAFWIYDGDPHDLNNIPQARRIVADLAEKNDIVIVSMHGGAEGADKTHTPNEMEMYLGEKRGNLPAFARAAVDAGADLVLGHGPHVPRAMELYKDRLIAYSLGNFCTIGFGTDSSLGYAPLLQAELGPDGRLLGGKIVSFIQTRQAPPALDPENRAAKLIHRLGREDFPESNAVRSDGTLVIGGK
jgi:poly-gamma-glutamate capsule biosynthesis protein CapA/YwtB (metallophosphatase superfamily)